MVHSPRTPANVAEQRVREYLSLVRIWQSDPQSEQLCPVCQTKGLTIVDRSARPHTEWYVLTCPACGLDATINVPLSSPGMD